MVHKCRDFGHAFIALKYCLLAFILPERMKLVDQKSSFSGQNSSTLREDEGQVFDMLQDEVTDEQVISSLLRRPSLGQVGNREAYILCLHFFPGFLDHPL